MCACHPGTTVLIIDDDPDIRDALRQVLEDEGYHVAVACDGQDALRQLAHNAPPTAILLDLCMPVMDGWEFRKHQLKDPLLAAIPLIVMSAFGSACSAAHAMGAREWMDKPIALEQLLNALVAIQRERKLECG